MLQNKYILENIKFPSQRGEYFFDGKYMKHSYSTGSNGMIENVFWF
jgi:hypothetical protein